MSVPLFLSPQPFRPATSIAAGLMGLVPSPAAGQQGFFLRGDALWVSPEAVALPIQTGATGKVLTSDGVNASWTNSVGPLTSTSFTGPIGSDGANSGTFTSVSASGQITSTVADGTAPLSVASTTNVANLNASSLSGATFASPGPIGSVTPDTASFSELTSASTFAAAITKTPVGYATGGNITLRFDLGSYGQIDLTTNAVFTGSSGMVRGRTQVLDLTNPSGGAFTLSWPGPWKLLNGALPTSIAAGQSIRVELNCGGTTEASIIAGYSLSGFVAGVLAPANGGTGVNNGSSTLTLGGSVTHSGNFTQSFTATANTALTLPVTGTLATLAGSEALSNKTITASTGAFTVLSSLNNLGGYQAVIGQATSGDRVGIAGQASGTGGNIIFFDNAQTTFRPGIIEGSSLNFRISGTDRAFVTATGLNNTAIGATTPSTVAATTITATGSITTSGGTLETNRTGAVDAFVRISADSGRSKNLSLNTAGARRWTVSSNSTAESGSNAGSDFVLTAYSDADASLGSALTITRSNRSAVFAGGINSTAIGATTPSTGAFTTLSASGSAADIFSATTTASGRTALFQNNTTFALVDIRAGGTNQSSYVNLVPTGTGTGIIQINGADKVAISSTGLAVTGTLSSTGIITTATQVTSSGSNPLRLQCPTNTNVTIGVDGGSQFVVNGYAPATFSQGLAVTGALSATGRAALSYLTVSNATPGGLGANIDVIDSIASNMRFFSVGTDTSTNGSFQFYSQRSNDSNQVLAATISSTGFAVTGALSATGQFTGQTFFSIGGSSTDYPSSGYNFTRTASAGVYNYTTTDFSSRLEHTAGGFKFFTAPSGTAGNAITFTERANITSTGLAVTGALSSTGTITSTSTGRNAFSGAIQVTGANPTNVAASTILDNSSGDARIICYGLNTSTRGTFTMLGISSDGSLNSTYFTANSTGLAVTGGINTTGILVLGGGSDFFNGSVRISDNASSTAPAYFQSGEPGVSGSNVILSNNYFGTSGGASGRKNSSVGASYLRLNVGAASTSTATLGVISASGTMSDVLAVNSGGAAVTGTGSFTGSGFDGGRVRFESTTSGNSIDIKGVNGAGVNDSAFITLRDGTSGRDSFIGLTGDNAPGGAGAIRFATGGNVVRATITSTGNVGIGVTAPGDKLEIGGSGSGIILASANGTRYRVTVSNLGVLTVAAV